jgi:hypothetical protein
MSLEFLGTETTRDGPSKLFCDCSMMERLPRIGMRIFSACPRLRLDGQKVVPCRVVTRGREYSGRPGGRRRERNDAMLSRSDKCQALMCCLLPLLSS